MNVKKMAMQAISELVRKKPFHEITVQDILEEAEISRGTFYKYYKDKYDLANEYYNSFVSKIIIKYNGHNLEEIFCEILEFIKTNKDYFFKLNTTSKEVNSFMHNLTNRTYNAFAHIYKYNMNKKTVTKAEEYQLYSISGACVFTVERWIINDCDLAPKTLAKNIFSFIPKVYLEYINK